MKKNIMQLDSIVMEGTNQITIKDSIDRYPHRSFIYHCHFTNFDEISQEVTEYYNSIRLPFQGVYLLRCAYKDITILKIGKSQDVKQRFISIRGGNPLVEMLGYLHVKNIDSYETELYSKFKEDHFQGEWFYNKENIIEHFINHSDFKTLKERSTISNRHLKREEKLINC